MGKDDSVEEKKSALRIAWDRLAYRSRRITMVDTVHSTVSRIVIRCA